MPVLGQRAFILAPTTDKFVALAGEEFTRKIDLTGFGNGWTKLRLALNFAIGNTGGGNITNTELFVGLCSGTAFPYGSQQCLHACGYVFGSQAASTWAWTAGAGSPYYTHTSLSALRRVGVTQTAASIGSLTQTFPAHDQNGTASVTKRRGWIGVTFTQSATQIVMTGFSEAAASMAGDVFFEHFMYATNQAGAPFVLETVTQSNTQTLTPGAGWNTNPLDTVDIYWSNPTYDLEIYAIAAEFTS